MGRTVIDAHSSEGPADRALGRRVAIAGSAFLSALPSEMRHRAGIPLDLAAQPEAVRFRGGPDGTLSFTGERWGAATWSNFPASDVPRPGLPFGDVGTEADAALWALLGLALSPAGLRKVADTVASDQVLAGQGVPYAAGRAWFHVAVAGAPDAVEPWALFLGGHHLALNLVFRAGRASVTPVLIGAQPAEVVPPGWTVWRPS